MENCFNEECRKEYFEVLRRWFSFKSPITRKEFDTEVRKLLVNEEQIRCHNYFVLALLAKRTYSRAKSTRTTTDKGVFEGPEYSDYVMPASPSIMTEEYENRNAAAELFMPDSVFIATRISIVSWQNGLDGAEENVTDVITHACQAFVKNIIAAMVSKLKGYKIRDNKFQYGFNLSIPDPFLRNYGNVLDETQKSKSVVVDDEDTFIPKNKPSLDVAEQQAAFAYSCAKRKRSKNALTVTLLYDVLRENPEILSSHRPFNLNLFKLGLQIDEG